MNKYSKKNVIVVDDDSSIRVVISTALTRAGFNVKSSGTAAGMWRLVETGFSDILITDVGLPDGDALNILPKLQKMMPNIKIIVMSARTTLLTAVRAEKKGAFDYLPKPFDIDELLNLVTKSSVIKPPASNINSFKRLQQVKTNTYESGPIIGRSEGMQEIYKIMSRLVSNNLSVLISGESGTGKKLIAKAIHDLSYRNDKLFINLNLDFFINFSSFLDSNNNLIINDYISPLINNINELSGCTILINEIANLTKNQQNNFIILLENNFVELSKNILNFTKPRVITCTKQNLFALVREGLFREDLYYRLNVVPIKMPVLRDRLDDIFELSNFFLNSIENYKGITKVIAYDGILLLKQYLWPGNIRELKNVIERLCLLSSTNEISNVLISKVLSEEFYLTDDKENEEIYFKKYIKNYLKNFDKSKNKKNIYSNIISKIEKPLIVSTLELFRGNQIKTAEFLGFNRNTLRKKIILYNIKVIKKRKF